MRLFVVHLGQGLEGDFVLEKVEQQKLVAPPVGLVEQEALEVLEEVTLALFADLEALLDLGKNAGVLVISGPRVGRVQSNCIGIWKRVLLPSDEFVDFLLVELAPEMLLFLRKMRELVMFTAQEFGSN